MRAAPLGLRDGDRERLESWVRSSTVPAGLARRARTVLLAAEGVTNVEVAQRVGVSLPTVTEWRTRYRERGIPGLADEARSGRPRQVDHRKIVAATLRPPPKKRGRCFPGHRPCADVVTCSGMVRRWTTAIG